MFDQIHQKIWWCQHVWLRAAGFLNNLFIPAYLAFLYTVAIERCDILDGTTEDELLKRVLVLVKLNGWHQIQIQ